MYATSIPWIGLLLASLPVLGWLGLRWLRRALAPTRLAHLAPSIDPSSTWVQIPTQGHLRLAAQWLTPVDAVPCRGVALLIHGWGGNGSQLLDAARDLQRDGWAVLLPDARSHGLSDEDSYSSLPRFAEDIDACLAWLSRQAIASHGPSVVLIGHSLGAAASLLAASRRGDLAAVVSVSSFAHPEQVMRRWLAAYRIPFTPIGWLVNRYIERVIGHRFDVIAPIHNIAKIRAPLLLVHGLSDDIVPLTCAQQLAAAAPTARLLTAPGRHDGFDDDAAVHTAVRQWLDAVTAPHAPP